MAMIAAPASASVDGVAAQLNDRVNFRVRRYAAAGILQARRERMPVDGGDRDHGDEQSDLRQQQLAVKGAEERRNTADEIPGVDRAGNKQRADADQSERGKTQHHSARDFDRSIRSADSAEQQRQRNKRSDPCRRGDQVQDIRGRMDEGFHTIGAGGVAGPGQRSGKSRGQDHGRGIDPNRFSVLRRQKRHQGRGEETRQDEARQPIDAKMRLRQHRSQHAAGEHCRRRLTAHRCCGQHKPHGARAHGEHKAEPGDEREPRPEHSANCGISCLAASRRSDHDNEEDHARRHKGGGEMDGAHINHRVGRDGHAACVLISRRRGK